MLRPLEEWLAQDVAEVRLYLEETASSIWLLLANAVRYGTARAEWFLNVVSATWILARKL